jgi:transposase
LLQTKREELSDMKITAIGLDLAKNVFQLHGVDEAGGAVLRKRLRRMQMLTFFAELPRCIIGIEACGSAHFWARELMALGHDVRIIPPSYVKPYVRRGKNDAADAEAICEAVQRPNMRFVPVKSEDQQSALMLHKARNLIQRQRTMLINALRAHMAELGVVAAQGPSRVADLVAIIDDEENETIPPLAKTALRPMVVQLRACENSAKELEGEIRAWHRNSDASQRLATIPGLGEITASAIAATVPDASFFRSGREFAAWLGLTPRQTSSGGKDRLGRTTKQGNRHIRSLLVIGATSLLRYWRGKLGAEAAWVNRLLERRPPRLVTVALANKLARIVWAVLLRGETFRPRAATTA